MCVPLLLVAVLLLPGFLAKECGPVPGGLMDTEGLDRIKNGNTAPEHALPWQALILVYDRVTTGTDLLGMVAEIAAIGLSMNRGFVSSILQIVK